uniref:Uncharacterized protein KIAA0355 homolog n=1 Tax=Petromyzon marinus TaxID=7757 RepID=A0AAJ7U671_PETMA|nr:uncharacterized protein KIAA0355 homolog [Petromyzon marinus]XP_032830595.1 uncharacterized protein KIAA0355 homolog [Petromyzon marinus]
MEAMKPQISLGGPPRKAVGGSQQTLTDWPSYASVAAAATTAASVTTTVAMAPSAAAPSAAAPAASPPGPARAQRVAEEVHSYLDALAACCAAGSRAAASFGRALDGTPLGEAAVGFAEAQEVVRSTAGALAALVRAEVSKVARGLGPTAPGDGAERGRQDIQVMGSCLSMLVQLQCSVLSQGVKTLLPVARALGHELAGDLLAPDAGRTSPDPDTEQRDALQTWRQAVQATAALRGRAPDGTLVGREVQKLFCCQGNHVAEAQLRELNSQVDHALQAYMQALERLHQSEFSMKAGFHRSPSHTEEVLQDCCIEAEAQQAGMSRLSEALVALELPTVSLHIGSAHLKGVPSSSLATADNLAAKMQAMRAFLKEALGVTTTSSSSQRDGAGDAGGTGGTVKIVPCNELGSNGGGVPAAAATLTGANGPPVASGAGHKTLTAEEELGRETLGHVCPSVWRGACKTAVQLLFGQAGLVVVDTAEVENREAYTPQISQEGDKIVVQVPSTWCVKEDPATMSLLRRWLDPERSVALVDVLYTATLEPARWRAGRAQALPCIQLLLRREAADSPSMAELPECTAASAKPSGGFQKTFSRLTSRLTKKHAASVTFQGAAKAGPSRHDEDKKAACAFVPAPPSAVGGAGSWKAASGPLAKLASSGSPARGGAGCGGATGAAAAAVAAGSSVKRGTGLNLPSDQEMQEVIDFLSGVGLSKSQQPSPMNQRRTPDPGAPFPPRYTGGGGGGGGGAGGGFPPPMLGALGPTTLFKGSPHGPGSGAAALPPPLTPQQQQQQQAAQVAQAAQAAAGIWSAWELHGRLGPGPGEGTAKTAHVRNNTWPNRFQPDGLCGVPEAFLSLDPAVKGDPEYARYVTGLAQVLQHQQQQKSSQHQHGPGHRAAPSSQAQPALGEAVAAGEWRSAPAAREIGEAARAWQCKESFLPKVAPGTGWLGLGGRPAQHGEEPLPANGHACFSMFSGPDLVAAVSQRRRHSSGEQQVAAVLSMPRAPPDTVSQEKTKTWPLKSPWMAASTLVPTSTAPYPDAVPPVPWYEDSAAPAVFPPSVWSTEACDGTAAVATAEFTQYIPHQPGAGAATQRLGAPGYGQGPGGERRVYTRPY